MKPNFALILSMDGIALLQRASPGWVLVGDAYPDSADLASDMAALRAAADRLAPEGATFKVVIPNDQIRYLSVPAGAADAASRQRTVETALDGATPYALDELVIDHSVSGDQILIAAVALDTVQEADEFARGFGFDPVSFVAMPETRDFAGEPFFGTAHDVPDDIEVIPDTEAIRVTGRINSDIDSKPEDLPDAPDQPETADALDTDPAPEAEPVEVSFSSRRQRGATGDEPQDSREPRSADEAPRITFAEPTSGKAPVVLPPRDIAPEELSQSLEAPEEEPRASAFQTALATGAGFAARVRAGIADRRAARVEARAEAARLAEEAAALPKVPQDGIGISNPSKDAAPQAVPAPTPEKKSKTRKGKKVASPAATAPVAAPAVAMDVTPEPAPVPQKRIGTASGVLSADERRAEEERLTVFGARNGSYDEGTRRSGTMAVAAILALFAVGTAGWAMLFSDASLMPLTGVQPEDEIVAAVEPSVIEDEPVPPGPEDSSADVDAEADTAAVEETAPADPAAEDGDAASPLIVTEAATAEVPEASDTPPSSAETEARYAASGIWQASPGELTAGGADGVDAGTGGSMTDTDAPPQRGPEVELATLQPDTRPAPPAPPPIFGKRYNMDARGLVIATPDGAETPSGVLAFAGDPPVVPPTRPGDPEPVAEEPETPEPEADPASDARLEDEAAPPGEAPAESPTETAATEPGTETQFAQVRPRLRPFAEVVAAETAAPDDVVLASAASLAGAAATAAAGQPLITDEDRASIAAGLASGAEAVEANEAEAEAIADGLEPEFVALRPLRRPGNIEELAAQARQTQEPPPAAAPSGPTSVSVARQATLRNAINLRDVNLIGVYGQPSDRRALVRLSNGRYRKVKVGDRMDGGRVLAIGDDTLRYQKNGRNVTLNMPSG